MKRLAHPSTIALEILPRTPVPHGTLYTRSLESPTLRHSDSLRLTIAAFGRTHRLHLRPNNELIHPAARITHLGPDGSVLRTVPLLRSSIHVFEGAVVDEAWSPHRLREDAAGGVSRPWGDVAPGELGWARIIVHHQGDPSLGIAPVYEGAFSVLGETYHILTRDNYIRTRGPLDAHPHAEVDELDSGLVIFRDMDMEKPVAAEGETCSHDGLAFNADISHPVMRAGRQGQTVQKAPAYSGAAWYDPLGLFDAPEPVPRIDLDLGLRKREDIAGSNSTSKYVPLPTPTSPFPPFSNLPFVCCLGVTRAYIFQPITDLRQALTVISVRLALRTKSETRRDAARRRRLCIWVLRLIASIRPSMEVRRMRRL